MCIRDRNTAQVDLLLCRELITQDAIRIVNIGAGALQSLSAKSPRRTSRNYVYAFCQRLKSRWIPVGVVHAEYGAIRNHYFAARINYYWLLTASLSLQATRRAVNTNGIPMELIDGHPYMSQLITQLSFLLPLHG